MLVLSQSQFRNDAIVQISSIMCQSLCVYHQNHNCVSVRWLNMLLQACYNGVSMFMLASSNWQFCDGPIAKGLFLNGPKFMLVAPNAQFNHTLRVPEELYVAVPICRVSECSRWSWIDRFISLAWLDTQSQSAIPRRIQCMKCILSIQTTQKQWTLFFFLFFKWWFIYLVHNI